MTGTKATYTVRDITVGRELGTVQATTERGARAVAARKFNLRFAWLSAHLTTESPVCSNHGMHYCDECDERPAPSNETETASRMTTKALKSVMKAPDLYTTEEINVAQTELNSRTSAPTLPTFSAPTELAYTMNPDLLSEEPLRINSRATAAELRAMVVAIQERIANREASGDADAVFSRFIAYVLSQPSASWDETFRTAYAYDALSQSIHPVTVRHGDNRTLFAMYDVPATPALVDAFVAAFNAQKANKAVVTLSVAYDPLTPDRLSYARMHAVSALDGETESAYGEHYMLHTVRRMNRFASDAASAAERRRAERLAVMRAKFRKNMSATPVERRDTSASFRAWIERRESLITPIEDSSAIAALPYPAFAQTFPTNTLSAATTRRWGIEIEHPDSAGIATPMEWERVGDCSLRSASSGSYEDAECSCDCEGTVYTRVGYDYYDVVCGEYDVECDVCRGEHDCTDSDSYDNDNSCNEFVSPILSTFHDDGLGELMNDLSNRNTNDSAGIHVHVDAPDYQGDSKDAIAKRARLMHVFALIQPIIVRGMERNTTEYCKPITPAIAAEYLPSTKARGTEPYAERYRMVNLSALTRHGTVEYRGMGPVYDYATLVNWAHFLRRLTSFVAENRDAAAHVQSALTFEAVVAVIGWEEN